MSSAEQTIRLLEQHIRENYGGAAVYIPKHESAIPSGSCLKAHQSLRVRLADTLRHGLYFPYGQLKRRRPTTSAVFLRLGIAR
jgi:hypothetical protein